MVLPNSRIFRERYRRYMTEQGEPDAVQQIRKIVDTSTAGKVAGHTVDLFTASALLKVYDALQKPETKEKFVRMLGAGEIVRLAEFAFKHLEGKRRIPTVEQEGRLIQFSYGRMHEDPVGKIVYGPSMPHGEEVEGIVTGVEHDSIRGYFILYIQTVDGMKKILAGDARIIGESLERERLGGGLRHEQVTPQTLLRRAGASEYAIDVVLGFLNTSRDSMRLYYLLEDLGLPEDVKERILAALSSSGYLESLKHEQFQKVKTITSHVGYGRFLDEVGDTIGYIVTPKEIPSPYFYGPFWPVYQYRGQPVVVAETSHKRYEVFVVPAGMVQPGEMPY